MSIHLKMHAVELTKITEALMKVSDFKAAGLVNADFRFGDLMLTMSTEGEETCVFSRNHLRVHQSLCTPLIERLMKVETKTEDLMTADFVFELGSEQIVITLYGNKYINPIEKKMKGGPRGKRNDPEALKRIEVAFGYINSLKNSGMKTKDIARLSNVHSVTVNSWVNKKGISQNNLNSLLLIKPLEKGQLGKQVKYCDLGKKITSYCTDKSMTRKIFSEKVGIELWRLNDILIGTQTPSDEVKTKMKELGIV